MENYNPFESLMDSAATAFLDAFGTIYSLLYDGKIKPADGRDYVALGDEWISANRDTEFFREVLELRRDYFMSDREVMALALALEL